MLTETQSQKERSISPASLEAEFDRNGFLVVPGVVSTERVEQIRKEMEKRFNSQPPAENLHEQTLFDFYNHQPEFLDTFLNARLISTLRAILGDDFVLVETSSQRGAYGAIHKDTTTNEQAGYTFHHKDDFRVVTVGMYLQDNDQRGGGLFVIPGTHKDKHDPVLTLRRGQDRYVKSIPQKVLRKLSFGRLFNHWDYAKIDRNPRGMDIPSKAGDVVIFDLRLLHRASRPKLGTPPEKDTRKIAIFSRCSRNNESSLDYARYLKTKGGIYSYWNQDRTNCSVVKLCQQAKIRAL